MSERPDITPALRVAELLDAYPELEAVLVETAPAFARLRNPVLRRTVARVTTLEKAATVADIPVRDLVRTLRRAAGMDPGTTDGPGANGDGVCSDEPPVWFDPSRVAITVDAESVIASGRTPLAEVLSRLAELRGGDILRVTSEFKPAPLLEVARSKGYRTYVRPSGPASFESFVARA